MGKHTRRVVAVIPAHNEQTTVGHTVASLKDQTIPPDQVLVVSDNSTDHTVQAAKDAGADTMVTTGNTHKKAGALNQALATLNLTDSDLVLIMDADTIMVPGWIERALVELQDPRVGAVGAVFQADSDRGWLRGCQAREWCQPAGTMVDTPDGQVPIEQVQEGQQVILMVAILVGVAAYTLTITGWAMYGPRATWYAGAILSIFWLERVVTVWDMGWRHRLVAALMVPELVYAYLLQWAHLKAVWQHLTNAAETWHLNDKETPHAVSV